MKKTLFTLLMLFVSMVMMAQTSRHKSGSRSSRTLYYVVVKAYYSQSDAEWANNHAPNGGRFGGVRKVIGNGKAYYLVLDNSGPYYSSDNARNRKNELHDYLRRCNWFGYDDAMPSVWKTRVSGNSETINKTLCDCDMCGPMEREHLCRRKGRWVITEGVLGFRCNTCDEFEDGCDFGCSCRRRSKR